MILFISHYAGRTGAPIALLQLLRWIRQNTDMDFDILLQLDGELAKEFKAIAPTFVCENRPKHLLSMRNANPQCPLRLPSPIRVKQYSLIYANTIANGSLVASSFSKSIPLITHCHEMDYWMDKLSQNEMPSTLARTTEFIACSNPSSGCLIKRGVLPSRIQVIPEPFTAPSYSVSRTTNKGLRQELGIPDDSFVVISGGAEPWRKGKDLFVQDRKSVV